MESRRGRWASIIFSGAAAASIQAQDSSTNSPAAEFPSPWTPLFELRAAGGFKDNLLLSPGNRISSAFIGTGADVVLSRLPVDGRLLNFLISADDRRYLDDGPVESEDFVLGLAQAKADLSPAWQIGLDGRYVFQDEVVDVSIFETNRQSLLVRSHSLAAMPNLRWNGPSGVWTELSATVLRSWYSAPLDDLWEGGGKLTVGVEMENRSSVQLDYSHNHRSYDSREKTALDGSPIAGTTLALLQNDLALLWKQNWDDARRWRTSLRVGMQINRDNGPGYYDHQRYSVTPQLRYVEDSWELELQLRYAHYDFTHQPAVGDSGDKRVRDLASARVRGERKLWKELTGFVEYEHEQSISNRPLDEYHVNTVSAGTVWEF